MEKNDDKNNTAICLYGRDIKKQDVNNFKSFSIMIIAIFISTFTIFSIFPDNVLLRDKKNKKSMKKVFIGTSVITGIVSLLPFLSKWVSM